MPELICKHCGKAFPEIANERSNGFCSNKCRQQFYGSIKISENTPCPKCAGTNWSPYGICRDCNRQAARKKRDDIRGRPPRPPATYYDDSNVRRCTKCDSCELGQTPSRAGTDQWYCLPCSRADSKRRRAAMTPEQYARWKRQQKEFYERNPRYAFDRIGDRVISENQATPDWLTEDHWDQIDAVYARSRQLTLDSGVQHHVDHIIPLRNPSVCGLHVPWNLESITATDNLKKNNSFDPNRGSVLFDD